MIERREGWGMASEAVCEVLYPTSTAEVLAAFDLARERGLKVSGWGAGRSYGDAALNDGNLLLDFSKMDEVVAWDPVTGRVTCQPAVTLGKLWRLVLPDGYWPPVVSGTMTTTLGGCLAAGVHGKNNLRHGPIGEHVIAFTLVTPDGRVREVTRETDPELFYAAIGGMGWLGFFTSVTLQMKRVHSGRLEVHPLACEDLDAMFRGFEAHADKDYVVGWIDAFDRSGRGQIHAARYFKPGEDPDGAQMLAPEHQELPSTFFGVVPKAWLWRLMKPFANRWGMRLVNLGRFLSMKVRAPRVELQTHARFNFLLDYVPRWKWIYKPGGLIQYQLFLPADRAREGFRRALELAREARLEPWLVVMKRHRPDPFLLSHGLDGYSLACDFPVTALNRGRLLELTRALDRIVVEAGGRFYFPKDSVIDGASLRATLGDDILERFLALKQRVDPDDLLSSNQYRRIFGTLRRALPLYPEFERALDRPLPERLAAARGARGDDEASTTWDDPMATPQLPPERDE